MPWLTTIGLIPLVGAAAVWLLHVTTRAAADSADDLDVDDGLDIDDDRAALAAPADATGTAAALARPIGLAASLLTLAVTIVMALKFDTARAGDVQFLEQKHWISQLGVSYALGVNGIGLTMVALSAVLVPICLLAGWNEVDDARVTHFVALTLVLETFMIGVFAARDVFLFYVFFEAMLIPVYFLIGRYGGPQRSYASVKFLLYSLAGGLIMLIAVIGLYVASGRNGQTPTFDFTTLVGLHLDPGTQKLLFLGFFIAFAIKAPMWPVHTWLPDAAAEAPIGTSVLLVGVLDKVGTFGMLRYCLPLFPDAATYFRPVIITLAVIGIVYGAILAIGQTDVMRLIAYTSISHFGFIILGIFVMTSQGQSGSTLYMVNHGISTAALFIVAGYMIRRRGSANIADFGGMQKVTPIMAGTFLVAGLSALALPGLSTFVSEFLVLVGTFLHYKVAAIFATLAIVLAALYALWWYQRAMGGPVREGLEDMHDLRGREVIGVAPLIALLLFLGFVAQPVLNVINPAVAKTMTQTGSSDPAPQVVVNANAQMPVNPTGGGK
ncbi:MAG TPA: NADH-quinone oxidoreductase subunit M [Mycobacterium sp.]|nr:NADH-quinone oxidoreductase subunit M [Mycobacterium sp.]